MAKFGNLAIDVERGRGSRTPGELLSPLEPLAAESVCSRATRIDHGTGERCGVVGIGEKSSPASGLWHGTHIGGDDRARAGHGFENGQPERLIDRRVDEEVRCSIKVSRVFEGYATDEDDVVSDSEFVNEKVQFSCVLLVTLGADDDKLTTRERRAGLLPGLEQPVAVLVAPERGDEETEGPRDSNAGHDRPSSVSIPGLEDVVVDRFWNQPDLVRIDFQILIDLASKAVEN